MHAGEPHCNGRGIQMSTQSLCMPAHAESTKTGSVHAAAAHDVVLLFQVAVAVAVAVTSVVQFIPHSHTVSLIVPLPSHQ